MQSQHFHLLAHLLLLDVQHGVVDGDEDVLRVHVVHQTTGREDLQDTLCKDKRPPISFQSVSDFNRCYLSKGKMSCVLGQEPHRYSLPNTHGRQLSGNQYKSERNKSMAQKTEEEPTRESSLLKCFSLTCVKSLAPATSTNITLLQSIRTA